MSIIGNTYLFLDTNKKNAHGNRYRRNENYTKKIRDIESTKKKKPKICKV